MFAWAVRIHILFASKEKKKKQMSREKGVEYMVPRKLLGALFYDGSIILISL